MTKLLADGLWHNNPALVQLLGLCPLLAVSTSLTTGFILGLATLCVLVLGNSCISLCRHSIAPGLRLPSFMLILATATTLIEILLQAYLYELYTQVGLFIPLIITNCTLLARAEAFAARQPFLKTSVDSLAMGLGFLLVLTFIGSIRGLLSPVLTLVLLPPGAFFLFAAMVAVQNWLKIPRNSNRQVNPRVIALHNID